MCTCPNKLSHHQCGLASCGNSNYMGINQWDGLSELWSHGLSYCEVERSARLRQDKRTKALQIFFNFEPQNNVAVSQQRKGPCLRAPQNGYDHVIIFLNSPEVYHLSTVLPE